MVKGKLNIVMDGQWGSTGKGKIAGYLALNYADVDVVINNNMPIAGHTFVYPDGEEIMLQQLPIGCINNGATIMMSSACGINLPTLYKELNMLDERVMMLPVG